MERSTIINNGENGEMPEPNFEIVRINDGLAFGHGKISGHDDEPEVLARVDETIQSNEILVPISRDKEGRILEDDGCGDGREAGLIFRLQEIFKKNLNRAKVFGGASVMTMASLIGIGAAKSKSLNEVFNDAIDALTDKDVDFGAHTDEHASGENCGCGAIDHSPEAVKAAVDYEDRIREVIEGLGVDTTELDDVYENFRAYATELPGQPTFSGRRVMDRIIQAGKVVKRLTGHHRERRIILNTVRGYTVNQKLIREATRGRAQAFAVDIWRLEDIAGKLFEGDAKRRSQAYLSELIYTLAVSAVLTKGDLPVYMTRETADASRTAAEAGVPE